MCRALVLLFGLSSLVLVSAPGLADYVYVQFNDTSTVVSQPAGSAVTDGMESADLDWVLEIAGNPTPEVVGAPLQSGYCVRIHYGANNAVFTLGNPERTPLQFEARQASQPASCSDEAISQFEFEINIVIAARTRRFLGITNDADVLARVSMQIPGEKNEIINVRDIQWRLEAKNVNGGEWKLVGGLNLIEGFSGSGWLRYRDSSVRHVLLLSSDVGDATMERSATLEDKPTAPTAPIDVQYGVKDGLEAPRDALTVDGVVWNAWDKTPIYKSLSVGWNANGPVPVGMQLCEDTACEIPLADVPVTDSPVMIRRTDINVDEKAYLIVEWALTEGQSVSIPSDDENEEVELSVAPVVSFGRYQRPLTACVGHLRAGQDASPAFTFRLGRQELLSKDLPGSIAENDPVQLIFDKTRDGADCPLVGLVSETLAYGDIKTMTQDAEQAIEVQAQADLFVGYAQLNGADYRNSLARWRETLNFYNAAYTYGRESKRWMDGVVFRAGERGGVQIQLEPSANFDMTLADESGLVETARALQTNTRVSSGFFAEQLAAIGETVGDAQINLIYFDDFPGGCGEYLNDIEQANLQVVSALVVSSVDGYTGEGAIRSLDGGLAHVCEERDNLRIYAFNWRERVLNLDWDRTFNLILDDWKS